MNTGYALFEILLTNAGPSPWWHLPVCIAMLACYLGVAYITHATQGFYSTSLSFTIPSPKDSPCDSFGDAYGGRV